MSKFNLTEITNIIYAAVTTVPGVAGLVESTQDKKNQNIEILKNDFERSINITDNNSEMVIDINIILIEGTNIKDIAKEVQIRVKYELEKLPQFSSDFLVNVIIKDLIRK